MAENSEQVLWASYRKLYINDDFWWGGWLGKGGRRTMFIYVLLCPLYDVIVWRHCTTRWLCRAATQPARYERVVLVTPASSSMVPFTAIYSSQKPHKSGLSIGVLILIVLLTLYFSPDWWQTSILFLQTKLGKSLSSKVASNKLITF